jgi:hypothetical protein
MIYIHDDDFLGFWRRVDSLACAKLSQKFTVYILSTEEIWGFHGSEDDIVGFVAV